MKSTKSVGRAAPSKTQRSASPVSQASSLPVAQLPPGIRSRETPAFLVAAWNSGSARRSGPIHAGTLVPRRRSSNGIESAARSMTTSSIERVPSSTTAAPVPAAPGRDEPGPQAVSRKPQLHAIASARRETTRRPPRNTRVRMVNGRFFTNPVFRVRHRRSAGGSPARSPTGCRGNLLRPHHPRSCSARSHGGC